MRFVQPEPHASGVCAIWIPRRYVGEALGAWERCAASSDAVLICGCPTHDDATMPRDIVSKAGGVAQNKHLLVNCLGAFPTRYRYFRPSLAGLYAIEVWWGVELRTV